MPLLAATTFADRLLAFLTGFELPAALPLGVEARSPYRDPDVQPLLAAFCRKYYADNRPRVAVLGINPGRLGNGRTGIAFTDPVALARHCGIAHALPLKSPELSSTFVYEVVSAMGGPTAFYQHFYVGSIYPLVLLKEGLNYNYYDAAAVTQALWPAMRASLQQLVQAVGVRTDVAVCLGKRNGQYLEKLNAELKLFGRIIVLDHPRYLMQYKRRDLAANVAAYVAALGEGL